MNLAVSVLHTVQRKGIQLMYENKHNPCVQSLLTTIATGLKSRKISQSNT